MYQVAPWSWERNKYIGKLCCHLSCNAYTLSPLWFAEGFKEKNISMHLSWVMLCFLFFTSLYTLLKIQINTKKTVEKDKEKQQKVKDAQVRSIYGMEKRCCNKIQNTESDFCCQKKSYISTICRLARTVHGPRERYILYLCVPSTILELSS